MQMNFTLAPKKELKTLIAPFLIPITRAGVRYGRGPTQRALWNTVGRRIQSRYHPFDVKTRFGFRFAGNTEDLVASYIYYFGIWEPAITEWICSLPLLGRTVVDVGAHYGWYSLLGARCVGKTGRVIAIEASPTTFGCLRHNIAINSETNIRLVNAAAWNSTKELRLFLGPKDNTGITTVVSEFSGLTQRARSQTSAISVQAAPISMLLRPEEVATTGLVKIDVEGAEQEVAEGLEPLLAHFPEDVLFILEVTPQVLGGSNRTVEELLRIFTDRGFVPYVIRNEYKPEFYFECIECGYPRPVELQAPITKQADIILSRVQLGCMARNRCGGAASAADTADCN